MPGEAPIAGFEAVRTETVRTEAVRTEAERRALDAGTCYGARHDLASPPERAYLDALPAARRDILHRFVRGVLRGTPEGLCDPVVCPPGETPDSASLDPEVVDGESVQWDTALSRATVPDGVEAVAVLPLPAAGTALVVPLGAIYGYDRFRPVGPVTACTPRSETTVTHPVDLAWLLALEGGFVDAAQAERIGEELAESVANLALARLAERVQSRQRPAGSLLEASPKILPAADRAAAMERRVTRGHPFHPCAKIRRGMTPAAGLAYAPEFADTIDLRFVAVGAEHALQTRFPEEGPSLARRLFEAFDGLETAVDGALPAGCRPGDYTVIPVHPWQFHHVLPRRYARERRSGRVVPVPYTHPATPLLNLRTVVPHPTARSDGPASAGETGSETGSETGGAGQHLPHCKLALGVQLTNVERTLSPQAVHNGPRATALLRDIADREPLSRLGVLPERAAACYHPPGGPHPTGDTYDDARHLSGLLRQNPYAHPFATDGARLVPAASLPARGDNRTDCPLVRELLDRYGATTNTTDTGSAALGFLEEYVDVVVPEHLVLLCKYGIALEAHLQNAVAVFEDGRPVAVLVRDFGGIRAHAGRLADHGLSIDTYPDSDVDADGREDLYRKLYYALFQNHLGELIVALVRSTPVQESECWSLVGARCREAFDSLRGDAAVPDDRVDRDEAALFADPAVHKALTAMRLRGKRHEYVTSRVLNPLAPFARR